MMQTHIKTLLTTSLLSVSAFVSQAFATDCPTDGRLKYQHSRVYLECVSANCMGQTTNTYKMTVRYKLIADTPPHQEARLCWKENVPADINDGRRTAHTIGPECPNGTNMTARWELDRQFKPITALATACDGEQYVYIVRELNIP
ncbi:hypothetical protein [Algicola sagamiensis]|uniref:hypothetical protein n=1 Tax=Algicola sagamiensis TaxID=163869 RepID=UPI001469F686|nr:hypothetical protein [Algicola sagamiensis]